ncbi:LOG family protein [Actinoplanes campanulatus]|uniref:LOG family protein n=1 Tax=Actinoplanes campanulatus TaxID=113559 RepID=UPI001954A275|nr:LOG family protein [Actinoplanes capillaceus]
MRAPGGTAVFFGGCVPASPREEHLAHDIGVLLAEYGFTLWHGGYNGLMEHAAKGAAEHGAPVVAVSVQNMPWGTFNPHVTDTILLPTMGARMHTFLDAADVVVAMGGGIGTLHELTAALWYAGNIRPVPVVIAGATASRLIAFLRKERWVYESPTRPLSFLHRIDRATDLIPHITAAHDSHRSNS